MTRSAAARFMCYCAEKTIPYLQINPSAPVDFLSDTLQNPFNVSAYDVCVPNLMCEALGVVGQSTHFGHIPEIKHIIGVHTEYRREIQRESVGQPVCRIERVFRSDLYVYIA